MKMENNKSWSCCWVSVAKEKEKGDDKINIFFQVASWANVQANVQALLIVFVHLWITSTDCLQLQFLIEFDGGEKRQGVFIIGATNRPDQMDPAILRSGRFGKQILVSLPVKDERGSILKALAKKKKKKHIDPNVDLCEIAQGCENFSGADLAMLMRRASKLYKAEIFEEFIATGGSSEVQMRHHHRLSTIFTLSKHELQSHHYPLRKFVGTRILERKNKRLP